MSRGLAEHQEAAAAVSKLELSKTLETQRIELARKRGAIERDRARLAAGTEALAKKQALARIRLDRSKVVAPSAGTVFRVNVHPGETIGNGPIVLLGDTRRMAVVAEVSELHIGELRRWVARAGKEGLVARAKLPDRTRVWGRVRAAGLGPIVGKASIAGVDPSIDVDDRVVEVTVELDDAPKAELGSLIRLPVDVRIWGDSVPAGSHPVEDEEGLPETTEPAGGRR